MTKANEQVDREELAEKLGQTSGMTAQQVDNFVAALEGAGYKITKSSGN